MPKAISLDNLQMLQIRLALDPTGTLRVHGEYYLKSGTAVIQVKNVEITPMLNAALQAVTAAELA